MIKTKSILSLLDINDKKYIYLIFFLTIIVSLVELISIGFILPIIGVIIAPEKYVIIPYLEKFDRNQLLFFFILVLITVYIFKSIFIFIYNYYKIDRLNKIILNLSNRLMKIYFEQPYIFFLNINTAQLITNITSETIGFGTIILHKITFLSELLIILGLVIFIIYLSPLISLGAIIFLTICSFLIYLNTKKKIILWGNKRHNYSVQALRNVSQTFNSIKETKLLGKENNFIDLFLDDFKNEIKFSGLISIITQTPRLILELIAVLGLCSIIIFLVLTDVPNQEMLTILGFIAVASFRLMPSLGRITVALQQIKYSEVSYNIIENIFKLKIDNKEDSKKYDFSENLFLKDIKFSYPGSRQVCLNGVNLEIKKNKTIGIVGESGAGKSTLINIILGLLEKSDGKFIIDGKSIDTKSLNWKKKYIGYVPQNIYITDDTLKKNIAFGEKEKEIDINAVNNSIKNAQLENFLSNLPQGLDTNLGEFGSRISGGEKQRIAIARALYHNPELLIFDEPTSSLDEVTEKNFMKVVAGLKNSKTMVIISHKRSILDVVDNLYVIKKGKINENNL